MFSQTLFIVSTPIGDITDISQHAIDILRTAGAILCEDTRVASKLLSNLGLNTKLISYRDQNHTKIENELDVLFSQYPNIALISDHGTPTISDPGFKLVNYLRENKKDIKIVSVPGPSAIMAALSISGLPTDNFTFLGFLPKTSGKQAEILNSFKDLQTTLIIYESPYRIRKLLGALFKLFGDRKIFIAKDLTKIYEETIYTTLSSVNSDIIKIKEKGEYTVVIAKKDF